jgi:hypothetical protein
LKRLGIYLKKNGIRSHPIIVSNLELENGSTDLRSHLNNICFHISVPAEDEELGEYPEQYIGSQQSADQRKEDVLPHPRENLFTH